jgi:D-alanyl-lipoteichoic acid acyltransferase DltB (MBOAT superfamily)
MLFNSYIFIFAFLPIVLAGYLALRRLSSPLWPIGWLVCASLVYYAWWKPAFVLLLLFSISVNFAFGKLLLSNRLSAVAAKTVLTAGIVFNLCLLGYFKYAGFFVSNVNEVFGAHWIVPSIILPIGISFITFQKIAFLVDAYRGQVHNFNLQNYMLFVTFFPQLIAGPIVHHAEIMPQLGPAQKRPFAPDFAVGSAIFIFGLFKKVVVADTLAVYADAGFNAVHAGHPLDAASAWVAVLSYSFQLYYDFSGYSDMAVGLARMFGIILPVNFYSPYKSTSIIEFWRRWHMTLSRFLRDYLYFPLGGNKRGPVRRYVNLMIVMVLGGLWHGANWTFAVWGLAHGVMLVINHAWHAVVGSRGSNAPWARFVAGAITFLAVTLAWVPFRAVTFADAQTMMHHLASALYDPNGWASLGGFFKAQFGRLGELIDLTLWFKPHELWPPALPPDYIAQQAKPVGLLLLVVGLATFLMPNTYQVFRNFDPALGLPEETGPRRRWIKPVTLNTRLAWAVAGMFVLAVLGLSRVSPFLYFQF